MTAARKKSATKAQTKPPLALVDDTTPPVEDATLASLSNSTEHIVGAVTRAIVEHRLLPGAKLVEQKLGDRFGVSRTIVRQALFRLSQLKLVRLEPARGAFAPHGGGADGSTAHCPAQGQ
jgi:Bacterial regulatory proteins, gntR family